MKKVEDRVLWFAGAHRVLKELKHDPDPEKAKLALQWLKTSWKDESRKKLMKDTEDDDYWAKGYVEMLKRVVARLNENQ